MSSLFLSSEAEGKRFKKFVKRSKFAPVTFEIIKIGITPSVDVILEKRTADSISLIEIGVLSG